ncbi:hypothetical protein TVAG_252930 [Trichomonas vaginalis G3]|uniref:E2F/DP family winged-helix DNA-binding domain-containing protein n=1 Tax=Trichomonas vaginalis (strain ATCC PRA-98 / G3) TaxID=412133 RepID=A2EXF2_TRIV3|nr:e2F-like (mammalian transcription factor) family [Trichomonas vaginalis G3]EAY02642.1 hypothetical protein TVAG_252930 [Trichomonas vaginalis G3]KAI5550139.1 e2F-like (mammalian transcription factor) family [Trichomonas vaginalis G3]|eukprot:XP_001314865.1 hypothetical protein [Trichomonas vaginalis G3]
MNIGKESNFANTVKNVINLCHSKPGEYIKVSTMAEIENCEKRRFYDLFNVLCAIGLCTKSMNKVYCWAGEENMLFVIRQEYERVEKLAINQDFWSIFKMPESPPIGQLALTTITLFLFFGSTELALKQICLVMTQKRSKMSQLLRRLYLSAFFLEQIGLIMHSYQIGTYNLMIDSKSIVSEVFMNLKFKNLFPFNSIASQLQRIEQSYIDEVKSSRYALLLQKMRASHITVSSIAEQEPIPIEPLSPVRMVEIY